MKAISTRKCSQDPKSYLCVRLKSKLVCGPNFHPELSLDGGYENLNRQTTADWVTECTLIFRDTSNQP